MFYSLLHNFIISLLNSFIPSSTILLFFLLNVFIPSSTIFVIFPSPPHFYCFPSSSTTFLLFSLHHHPISIVFPLPPPHFYCFSSTTTPFLLFFLYHHHHHHRHISIVFPPPPALSRVARWSLLLFAFFSIDGPKTGLKLLNGQASIVPSVVERCILINLYRISLQEGT